MPRAYFCDGFRRPSHRARKPASEPTLLTQDIRGGEVLIVLGEIDDPLDQRDDRHDKGGYTTGDEQKMK